MFNEVVVNSHSRAIIALAAHNFLTKYLFPFMMYQIKRILFVFLFSSHYVQALNLLGIFSLTDTVITPDATSPKDTTDPGIENDSVEVSQLTIRVGQKTIIKWDDATGPGPLVVKLYESLASQNGTCLVIPCNKKLATLYTQQPPIHSSGEYIWTPGASLNDFERTYYLDLYDEKNGTIGADFKVIRALDSVSV